MDFVHHLKSSVDIVRTIGEYVRLRKVGARFSGLCPFHIEKTPSFSVNPAMGIFICFGCGKKGDVLNFIQEFENISFYEAMKLLAERNGIAMPARRERDDHPNIELREAAHELHEMAAKAFQENLWGPNGSEARDYLRKRGLSQKIAEHFGMGLTERSGQDFLRRIKGKFSSEQLEGSGLFGRREDGSLYDRFRGRLMFPIHNESGKVIGFGGRSMRPDEEPKYLNSPESVIYKKSNILYNLHRAKQAIRTSDRAVLVEGYMDVIGVYSAGVKEVVASCGTSLTKEQVRVLRRHSENVVVNFDPDTAGTNATEKSLQILLDDDMHVRILELDGGLDPDEYIKNNGADKYKFRLDKALGYFLWLADRARKKADMSSAESRIKIFETVLLPAIRRISDKLERAAIAGEVADYLGVDRSIVLKEFRTAPQAKREKPSQQINRVPVAEQVLLRSIMSDPEVAEALVQPLAKSDSVRRYITWPVLKIVLELVEGRERVNFQSVESRLLDEEQRTLLASAVLADNSGEVFSREQAGDFLGKLAADDLRVRVDELRNQIKQAERSGDLDRALRLSAELSDLQRASGRKA